MKPPVTSSRSLDLAAEYNLPEGLIVRDAPSSAVARSAPAEDHSCHQEPRNSRDGREDVDMRDGQVSAYAKGLWKLVSQTHRRRLAGERRRPVDVSGSATW